SAAEAPRDRSHCDLTLPPEYWRPPRPATEGGPMKTRHVYTTPDLPAAQKVMGAARSAGVADDDILLVARSDIELQAVPDHRKEADSDMLPAAARGAGMGAGAGLLAGLVAVAIPPLGVTLAGAAATTIAGAAVGSWSAALMGSSLPDPVRQRFQDRID